MNTKVRAFASCIISLILVFSLSLPTPALAHQSLVAQSPTELSKQVAASQKSLTMRSGKTSLAMLYAGSSTKGSVSLKVAGKSAKKCKWTSSNKSVVKVSKTGKVTAKKAGSANVTARFGRVTYTCRVIVKNVSINKSSASLDVGQSITLSLVGDKAARVHSSDSSVASVNASGKVSALSGGSATVTLISRSGKAYKCQITVKESASSGEGDENITPSVDAGQGDSAPITVPVESVAFPYELLELAVGGKSQSNAALVQPSNATNKTVRYSSSDSSVAAVDAAGNVTPKSAGEAVITVTTDDGAKSASCKVTVAAVAVPVESIAFSKASLALVVGDNPVANPAIITPTNATNTMVSYESSNPAVAFVDSVGLVTPASVGEAVITATSMDGSQNATCRVVVSSVTTPVAAVSFAQEEIALTVGGAGVMNAASVSPANATSKSVVYVSSDSEVATVDSQGFITPKSAGETVVTATSEDGAKSAACRVVVTEPSPVSVTGISFKESQVSLMVDDAPVGNPLAISPENATNRNVSYVSSNSQVASVDQSGVVTPVQSGTAMITATSEDGGKSASYTVVVMAPEKGDGVSAVAKTQAVELGETAVLSCSVDGVSGSDYSLKWRSSADGGKTWSDCVNEGSDTSKLQVVATENCLDMQYQCAVTYSLGKVALSEPLNVQVANLVAKVTTSKVAYGAQARLACSVFGNQGDNLYYQWQRSKDAVSWEDIAGATTSSYSVKADVSAGSYRYRCVVTTDSERSAFSESIALDIDTSTPDVSYKAHVKDVGWMSYVKNGQTAGTTGRELRMEAVKLLLNAPDGSSAISYRAHVAEKGWLGWVSSDAVAGTVGEERQMEALQVKLTGDYASLYDIYYRVHVADIGWLGWAKNGETAGSTGMSVRVEAVEVKLVAKGESFDRVRMHELVKPKLTYQAHLADIGWSNTVSEGATAGTVGQSRRMEALKVNLFDFDGSSNGIYYKAHLADTGWQSNYVGTGAVAGTVGEKRQMECITMELSGGISKVYDLYYRVHAQDYGWLGWAKNGEWAGTTGGGLQMEAIEVKLVVKGTPFDKGGVSYHDVDAERTAALKSQAQVRLNVPHYYQTDSRWANVTVSTKTIGQIGCLITSLAMIHSYHTGTTVYPNAMKNMLSFSGNSLIWSSATRLGYEMTGNYNSSINNSIMSLIYSRLKKGEPVIIGGASGSKTHWVVITGYTGSSTSSFNASDFTINDPNSSSRTTLASFLNYRPSVLRLIY